MVEVKKTLTLHIYLDSLKLLEVRLIHIYE